jgi:thiamine pyrophosphate-dependent acetolactate synthase large subunit-like protein
MDVVAMFEPLTKWATPIIHQDNIPEVVRKAFKMATTEKPGAVHIELAEDIAKLETDTRPIPAQRMRRPVPDDKIVDQALAVLRSAKNPIILAGNGAIRKRASAQLRRFAEQTGIGVVNTFMGKGSSIRSTRARRCSMLPPFRPCCSRATMRSSRRGAGSSRSSGRRSGGPTCFARFARRKPTTSSTRRSVAAPMSRSSIIRSSIASGRWSRAR